MPTPEDILFAARQRVTQEAAAVAAIADRLDGDFLRVVELLSKLQGKVFITGSGTSGIIARRMAHLLTVCGTPALYLQPMDALHGAMGAVAKGDVLIAISRGGASSEINDLVKRLRDLGVAIVALSSAPQSELARLADISVTWDNPPGSDPGNIIAMGSTLAVGVWGDALAYVLMVQRQRSWDQFLHNHPAGSVGQLTETPPDPRLRSDEQ
jgi:arabinose-5-phosphate isomerase